MTVTSQSPFAPHHLTRQRSQRQATPTAAGVRNAVLLSSESTVLRTPRVGIAIPDGNAMFFAACEMSEFPCTFWTDGPLSVILRGDLLAASRRVGSTAPHQHPPRCRYLLQLDLLGLEDVQHPAVLNLREILPEVKPRVRVAEQADLGQRLPLGWARGLLLLLLLVLLRSLLAGLGSVVVALYLCILLPPGFNFLES